jgi:signal transduction histidine kinase
MKTKQKFLLHIFSRLFVRLLVLFVVSFSTIAYSNDSLQVIKLNKQATQLLFSNPVKSLEQLEKALSISEKIKYDYGKLISYKNVGNAYFHLKRFKEATINYRSALHFAETTYNVLEIAHISLSLGKSLYYTGDIQNALFYLYKASNFYKIDANIEGLYNTYQTLSMVYQSQNDYYQALHYGIEALKIIQNTDNKEQIVLSLGNLGQIYSLLNQYERALEHYLMAITIAEAGENNTYLPILYIHTGVLYKELDDFQHAVSFLLKAYNDFYNTENAEGMITSLWELGQTYHAFSQPNKALNYFVRAKSIAERENNFPKIFEINKEIAQVYIQEKNFHKALIYLDQNFNLAKELRDIHFEADALFQIGRFYVLKGDFYKSIDLLNQSNAIAQRSKNIDLLSQISQWLATAYSKTKQFEKAYTQLKISVSYSNQKQKQEEQHTFMMLQSIFEITNNERELELLKKTNEIERIEKERALTEKKWLRLGVVFLLCIIVVLIYIALLIRKKNKILNLKGLEIEASNLALLEMNISLEKKKKELSELNESQFETNIKLKQSEERYKEANATKDTLLSIISHDLRSPFSAILSFVRVFKRDFQNLSEDEKMELIDSLDSVSNRIQTLLENLLQWSMIQSGKMPFNPKELKINDLIEESIALFKPIAKNKNIQILFENNGQIIVHADNSMVSAVLRNLLSNAIKFSQFNSNISINVIEYDGFATVSITDAGKGFSPEEMDSIIKKKQIVSKTGTNEEKGTGLGLILSYEFLQKHDSSVYIENYSEKGTTIAFTLKTSNT